MDAFIVFFMFVLVNAWAWILIKKDKI